MSKSQGISRRRVLATLRSAPPEGVRAAEVAQNLGMAKNDQYRLRKIIAGLLDEGVVCRIGRGRYILAESKPDHGDSQSGATNRDGAPGASDAANFSGGAIGRISVHPAGYGFVALDDDGDAVFVPAKFRGSAMDGDRVELSTWQGYKGTEGQVVRVLSRGRAKLTGTLRRVGRAIVLEPDDPRIATDYGFVPLIDGAPPGKVDQAAVVEICRYPTQSRPELVGRLLRILGAPDDPRTEIAKILICADVPVEFPPAALALARNTPTQLTTDDHADRIDLRDREFFTIDPEDARDFDDALCVEDGPKKTIRVWVAIADVSHYVHTDDAIDREASIRGVSVYLPDRAIPMLPAELSSGICSLKPDVDRCAMVVRIDFSPDGAACDCGFAAAVIRSRGRLDYTGVAAALAGDFRGRRMHYRRFAAALGRLDSLAQTLRERRLARGALMLDIPEAKVLLDDDDPLLVRDIVRTKGRPRSDDEDGGSLGAGGDDVKRAYELVEEFMIAANEAVGEFFDKRGIATIWRIHAAPELSRLEDLSKVFASHGIDLEPKRAATPIGLKEALVALSGTPEERALSSLILRSLKQAMYDVRPIGHFGLASPRYLHFTSPIRRYPDLLVHRLLKHALHSEGNASGGGAAIQAPSEAALDEMAAATSEHERRALSAEREVVAMYRAYLMREQVGEELPGRVSAITNFGAFVELDEPFVEGLIKLDHLGDDTYVYDEMALRLTGKRTGFKLELGDSVLVRVVNVSVPLRRIDLTLLSANGKQAGKAGARPSRPGKKRGGKGGKKSRAKKAGVE